MIRRTRAREVALQLLFQRDLNPRAVSRAAVERFARERLTDRESIAFCMSLYDGVNIHREAIDTLLSATASNWRLSRMMPADRNVLRIGTFELRHVATPEPVPVVLNEAIELSRRFGTENSPSFVNGVLDKIAMGTAATAPTPTPETPEKGTPEPAAPEKPSTEVKAD